MQDKNEDKMNETPRLVLTIQDDDGKTKYFGLDETKEELTFIPMQDDFNMNVVGTMSAEQSEIEMNKIAEELKNKNKK